MSKGALSELFGADIPKFRDMIKDIPKSEYVSILSAFTARSSVLEGI